MQGIGGLATGIGSLPHKDADLALDLIFKYLPNIPFWPQLPGLNASEGMVAQFCEHIPCLELIKNKVVFNSQNREKELEVFYEKIISDDLEYFRISQAYACGLYKFYQRLEQLSERSLDDIKFIKCHVTGPFTFASSINDEKGVALLHDEVFMQVVVKAITMKALWQIKMFKKFSKKIILFIDEPYLGCFGSAYAAITKDKVVNILLELTRALKAKDVFLGVHCCGNTDWSIFTDTAGIDIINFDAFAFFDRLALYSANLKAFFDRQGILCWGIVPTNDFNSSCRVDDLFGMIKRGADVLVSKGVNRKLITENLLVSPACGLGTLKIEESEKIIEKLSEISLRLREGF